MSDSWVRPGELFRRVRQVGVRGVAQRISRDVYARLDAAAIDFTILDDDLVDSAHADFVRAQDDALLPAGARRAGALRIGFLCTAPGPGSGGHTTLFRMVKGLEDRGFTCVLFLYDPHGGDPRRRAAVIRTHWPELAAEIRSADEIDEVDAIVASSWETAHVLVSRVRGRLARLYFVQDFEPFFYPRGSLYSFAEDSYRFGLRTVALGNMVASLVGEYSENIDVAPFGCDTDVYSLDAGTAAARRTGVIFYAKPDNDRRGYLLGKRALEVFHRANPAQEIHVYGDPVPDWTIPVTRHGRMTPTELNGLYNRVVGGLALSFTNISLVAEEMLAAGAIPVINESALARADLPNPEAAWAAPTPNALANALSDLFVGDAATAARARQAAAGVRRGWGQTQTIVADAVLDEVAKVTAASLPAPQGERRVG